VISGAGLLLGGSGADSLVGAGGADTLDGGAGADTMVGGAGDDVYIVDDPGDRVIDPNGNGTDHVFASVSFNMGGTELERLTLTGVAAINGTGNSIGNWIVGNGAANRLWGLGGDDTLDGGAGADTMEGGIGNDLYYVDDVNDRVIEANGAGFDTVISSVSFSLAGAEIEQLVLTGAAALNGVGNSIGNVILGNLGANRLQGLDGNDTLDGGPGADTMEGGTGDDTFYVDNPGDRVIEFNGQGFDEIFSSVSYALAGTFVERLTLTGVSALDAWGNSQPNHLVGNAGANRLDGLGGADTMEGGAGDDIYVVDHVGDRVIELPGNGFDRVFASVTYSIAGQAIEQLSLTGSAAINGFGNELNNRIGGNSAANFLAGADGNDTILGGGGDDTIERGTGFDRMDGGVGNDLYRVLAGQLTSSDLIADEAGSEDTLEIMDALDGSGLNFLGIGISGALAGRIQGIERFLLGSGNDVFLPGNEIADSADTDVMTVSGGAGNDRLDVSGVARLTTPLAFLLAAGDGADTVIGGRGADTIMPGSGNDSAAGGLGDDVFLMMSAEFNSGDTLNGGSGTDTLRFVGNEVIGAAAFANVSGIEVIELDDGGQRATLPGAFAEGLGFTMATIRGGAGDDLIDVSAFASNRRVTVELGDGNDTLFGGIGNDTVFAGSGADEIHVGTGINRVTFGVGELSGLDIVTATTTTAFDTLVVGVAAGRTLSQGAFAGVSGFDTFNFAGGEGSAVRLPSTLVSQSGQSSVSVNVTSGSMAVDGRAIAGAFRIDGGSGNDTLFGGSGADTLIGNGGDDVHVGGTGGDRIFLGASATSRDIALLRAVSDGTADINTTQSLAGADSVSGTEFEGNFIMVDRFGFGLPDATTWFIDAAQNISLNYSAARLTGVSIAADDFGSLTAVRNAVGARFTNNDPLQFEKLILVITGASNTRFGVYYFEDRDHNTTVDSTDILRLLAIGTGAGPTFGGNSGFRLTSEFELL
jgi:Ca2+-binding RTX toxin-like protein